MKPKMMNGSALAARLLLGFVLIAGLIAPLWNAGAQTAIVAQPLCIAQIDPVPSGPAATPNPSFPANDHFFVHSSTALQGVRSLVKYAGGLLHNPVGTIPGFGGFTSAIVVNNPDPAATVSFHIDYYDHTGALIFTSNPPPIPPEGTHVEAATPLSGPARSGIGSAVIIVDEGPGIVGEVLLHTESVFGIFDQDVPLSTNGHHPGAASVQQLQIYQDLPELWWGPLPLTNVSNVDFFNGQFPFLWVVNPNALPNRIRVELIAYNRQTGVVSAPFVYRTITLPPWGTLFEKSGAHLPAGQPPGLWDTFLSTLFGAPGIDYDVMVHIVSEDGFPILGDGVMTDFYGDGIDPSGQFPPNLLPAVRFRMASTMLAQTPTWRLVNPDLSYQPGGIVQTPMGIFNAGTSNSGPIRIEYFNRNGILISTGSIPNLTPGQSARIEPNTFGYPANTVGWGWTRITGCTPSVRLVGWHLREILPTSFGEPHYHKAYADGMIGNHGQEPGPGFNVTVGGQPWIRRVMPLVRTDPSFFWPGYSTFVNNSVSNIGRYWFRFFGFSGANCTNPAGQPFGGLPWAFTSTTLEDPQSICFGNLSGRVDHATGRVEGIHVLGDPFDEFKIPGFGGTPSVGVVSDDVMPH